MTTKLPLTEELSDVLDIAKSIANENANEEISPSHIIKALLNKDFPLRRSLESMGKDVFFIDDWADLRISKCKKVPKITKPPGLDSNAEAVFEEADLLRIKLGKEHIEPFMVLAALSIPGVGYTYEQLKTFPITSEELLNTEYFDQLKQTQPGLTDSKAQPKSDYKFLYNYCIDKSSIIESGLFDPVKCREKEIRLISETLCRRTKPNAILVGEPGVGKSAIIDGLAAAILDGKVPKKLQNAKIFELDFGALIAGASYKGEVEDRLKKIIAEIKTIPNTILFIDEIHLMLDKHGGATGAANLIKPELARGGLTIIGATTNDEFAKFIEGDEAFMRRFEKISINEPNEEDAFEMLKAVIPKYAKHHMLEINDNALKESIKLAKRFNKDRKLPDAGIDLIDKTMAALSIYKETAKAELDDIVNANDLLSDKMKKKLAKDPHELTKIKSLLSSHLNYLLIAKASFSADSLKTLDNQKQVDMLSTFIDKFYALLNEEINLVDTDDLYAVVSFKTGIPLGKLQTNEQERLIKIEDELQKRIIGQDHAIHEIAQAIRRARAGLRKQNKPVGSFFLVGPTGTGKTELARTLADYLFQDENAMLRFDMSEFTEEASVSLLHGASPGYVGYEEGGLLVNEIRQQPYSVVLFDEIEKAHASVFKIFYQVLDEGKLHDKLGKEGDFTNAIILFTSNIGSEIIIDTFQHHNKLLEDDVLKEEMKKYFQPAFINRLDKIIPFAPIRKELVHLILNIHINKVRNLLKEQNIFLEISDPAIEALSKMGFSLEYGARPILGVIRDHIETPLSNMIINGELKNNSIAKLDQNEKELTWECAQMGT